RTEEAKRQGIVVELRRFFVLGDGASQITDALERPAQTPVRGIIARIHFDGLAKLRDRLLVATGDPVNRSGVDVVDDGERIELERAFHFSIGTIKLAESWKRGIAEPVVRSRIIRVQLNSFLELAHRSGKIEIKKSVNQAERCVR